MQLTTVQDLYRVSPPKSPAGGLDRNSGSPPAGDLGGEKATCCGLPESTV